MTKHFDLIVIGGGSAGLATAKAAASYGATVALIENDRLGGTCVNLGCIPKKIMWYAGKFAGAYQLSESYGFHFENISLDFEKLVNHRDEFIKSLNSSYENRLSKDNITYLKGSAIFRDTSTIQVNNINYSANHIVIATGCVPKKPDIKGIDFAINSDGFFSLKKLPQRIAIIGSGYIGVEFASILNQLGSEVKFLIRYDRPLREFDSFISDALMDIMKKQGIEIYTHHIAREIKQNEMNKYEVICEENNSILNLDTIIYAIGRTPRTHFLNLENASIKTDDEGFIITDKWEQTNIDHIYAIGDVTGKNLLTPVAIMAGRKLASRIFGGEKDAYLDYNFIPTAIFSLPSIGSIGLSEREAKEKYGRDQLVIYENQFNPLIYALNTQLFPSKMKLITMKDTGKIVGCHMIGIDSDEILQGFAVAMKMGATKKDLENTLSIHPTNAEELLSIINQNYTQS